MKSTTNLDGWGPTVLENLCSRMTVGIATSTTKHYQTSGVPILRNLNIKEGQLEASRMLYISSDFDEKNKSKRLRVNDVITVRTGFAGISCVVPKEFINAQTFTTLITTPNPDQLDSIFLSFHLNSELGAREFYRLTGDAGRSNLNVGQFRKYKINLPPLPEQKKIAEILGVCDEAIEAQERLIAHKKQRKKGLMQQLLSGKLRFPEFIGIPWNEQTLSDQLKETPRKVKKPQIAFKTAGVRCHARGIFAKPDMLPDEIALDELFEIKAGDIVVNISFAWEHAIAVADEAHDGALVSHRFPTFACRPNVAASSFFKYFVQQPRMRYDLKCVSPGGAGRNRVLSKKDFKKLRYKFPSFEEQLRIGEFLDTCTEEVKHLEKKLEQLKQQKKGLMQQLLTGKVRVKV